MGTCKSVTIEDTVQPVLPKDRIRPESLPSLHYSGKISHHANEELKKNTGNLNSIMRSNIEKSSQFLKNKFQSQATADCVTQKCYKPVSPSGITQDTHVIREKSMNLPLFPSETHPQQINYLIASGSIEVKVPQLSDISNSSIVARRLQKQSKVGPLCTIRSTSDSPLIGHPSQQKENSTMCTPIKLTPKKKLRTQSDTINGLNPQSWMQTAPLSSNQRGNQTNQSSPVPQLTTNYPTFPAKTMNSITMKQKYHQQ